MKRFIRGFAMPALFCAGLVQAHPNGTTKTSIRLLDADSVTVTVEFSHDDYIYLTHPTMGGNPGTVLPEEARFFQEKMEPYLLSRVNLLIDGRPLDNLRLIRWKPNGKGPEDGFLNDQAAFWTPYFDITFGGRLPPPPRKKIDYPMQLFVELGQDPISEVDLYWHDTLVVQKWLGLDRTFHAVIAPDSLAALLQQTRRSPAGQTAHPENLVARFITLGYLHILGYTRIVVLGFHFIQFEGLDHILFVLGLFFFSTRMRPLLWQITAFTIAHSITLGLAMVGVFSLSARVVEPLIALSIAVVGFENIFFRQVKSSRWLIVFGFGLIHGMGFASALRELGLPQGKFWPVLASFNAGVELGQLTIVTAAFLLTRWFWNKPWYFKRVVVPVSSVITMVAVYWVLRRTFNF